MGKERNGQRVRRYLVAAGSCKILHPNKAQMMFLCLSHPLPLGCQLLPVKPRGLAVSWRHGFARFQRLNSHEKQKSLPLTILCVKIP